MCVCGEPKNFNFRLTYSLTFDSLSTTMFINSTIFAITERILARWLVESYGLWEYRPWKWRNMSPSAGCFFCFFGFSWKNNKCYCKKQIDHNFSWSTSYSPQKWRHKLFKTLQWNHSPAAPGSTWVLNILWRHFYGIWECRPWKIVVDLLNLFTINPLKR